MDIDDHGAALVEFLLAGSRILYVSCPHAMCVGDGLAMIDLHGVDSYANHLESRCISTGWERDDMALVARRECSASISTEAPSCPRSEIPLSVVATSPVPFHRIQTNTAANPASSSGFHFEGYSRVIGINTEIIAGQQQDIHLAYSANNDFRVHAAARTACETVT